MLRPGSGPPQRGQSSASAPGKITEAVSNDASNGVARNEAYLFMSKIIGSGSQLHYRYTPASVAPAQTAPANRSRARSDAAPPAATSPARLHPSSTPWLE